MVEVVKNKDTDRICKEICHIALKIVKPPIFLTVN